MKVVNVFNMACNGLAIVKALRAKGFDADLLLNSDEFGMSMPMWEEMELNDIDPYNFDLRKALEKYDLPRWIKIWWADSLNFQNIASLFKMVEPYDLLHLHPPSPVYLQFSYIPFIIYEAGWIRRLVTRDSATEKLGRRAYAKAECIVMTNPDTYALLRRLKYKREVFIPFVIDVERYKPMKVEKSDELLFFHPTRHTYEVKGNDRLLYAFSRFIKEGYRARLRMVDWGWQEDIEKSHVLVKGLGLEKHVEWVQPYSKPSLIRAYNEADAVFDQFILGSSGTTGLEAMACGVPVVIYLNDWNMKCFGEMPPVVNASSVQEIYESMVKLTDKNFRRKVGREERRFIVKHDSPDVVAEQFIKLYKEILD